MVHQYRNNGYNIALDVDSGSVHILDDLSYQLIAELEKNRALTDEELTGMFRDRYDPSDIQEALSEIHGLESAGQLFTEEYRARLQSGMQVLFRRGRRISRKTGAHEL